MKKLSLIFLGILTLGLSSCSNNDETTDNGGLLLKPNVAKTLTLTVSGNNDGSRATGTPSTVSEATVKNLVVAIYDNNNNVIEKSQNFNSPTVSGNTIEATISFNTTNPSILVAANVPADVFKKYDETTATPITSLTKDDFKTKFISLDLTANDDLNNQLSTQLPMIGSTGAISPGSEANSYTASVQLNRMVSRIKLASITTNFQDEQAGDQFVVEEVFIRHANTESNLFNSGIASDVTKFSLSGQPAAKSLACGVTYANMKDGIVKEYLKNEYSTPKVLEPFVEDYFYVFPNYNSAFEDRTQLVIKGTYTHEETAKTVYYPIEINREATTDGKVNYTEGSTSDAGNGVVAPNRQYSVNVTITGEGQDKETFTEEADPNGGKYNVKVTVDVAPWITEIVQNVKF